jgi:hypothetical protein
VCCVCVCSVCVCVCVRARVAVAATARSQPLQCIIVDKQVRQINLRPAKRESHDHVEHAQDASREQPNTSRVVEVAEALEEEPAHSDARVAKTLASDGNHDHSHLEEVLDVGQDAPSNHHDDACNGVVGARARGLFQTLNEPRCETCESHRAKVRAKRVLCGPGNVSTVVATPVPVRHDVGDDVVAGLEAPERKPPKREGEETVIHVARAFDVLAARGASRLVPSVGRHLERADEHHTQADDEALRGGRMGVRVNGVAVKRAQR